MSHSLFVLLAKLDSARYHYTLHRSRPDTIRVDITFVGERVEVDVFEDGHMEVCRFRGSEGVEGDRELIHQLIAENAEADQRI
jgi:hypothetical protein